MNKIENQKEQLSVLMDDIKLESMDLNEIAHDAELKETWSRMHLVRSVLHDEYVSHESFSVSSKVMAALEDEPSLSQVNETVGKPSNVVKLPSLWKQVSGFAIAASVCSVVIFGVQENNKVGMAQPDIAETEVRSTLSPFAQRAMTPVSLQSTNYEQAQRERMRRLYAEHLKKAKYYGVQPTMPYVKLVNIKPVVVNKKEQKQDSQ